MEVAYSQKALADLNYWRSSGNLKVQKKISNLIDAIQRHPFTGIGKPEALKYELTGKWSRRINEEHRLVYAVDGNRLKIYALKGHY